MKECNQSHTIIHSELSTKSPNMSTTKATENNKVIKTQTKKSHSKMNNIIYMLSFLIALSSPAILMIESASIPDSPSYSSLSSSTSLSQKQNQISNNHNENLGPHDEDSSTNNVISFSCSVNSNEEEEQEEDDENVEILTRRRVPSPLMTSSVTYSTPNHHTNSHHNNLPTSLHTATASMTTASIQQQPLLHSNHSNQMTISNDTSTNQNNITSNSNSNTISKTNNNNSKSPKRTLTLIRLLFITYYSSLGSLMPYLPVYFHSLGHTGYAIGLLGAIKPLTTFLVAPFWGLLSDYYQNPSFILQITFLSSYILQLLVPAKDDVLYLMTMVFLTALFNAPVKSLIDSMVMDELSEMDGEDGKGQYGKLRLWGQLGFGLGSSIVGNAMSKSNFSRGDNVAAKIIKEQQQNMIWGEHSSNKSVIQTIHAFLSNPLEKIVNMQGYQLAFLAYGLMSIPSFIAIQSFRRINHGGNDHSRNNDVSMEKQKQSNVAKGDAGTKNNNSSPKILQGLNMLLHNSDALLFFSLVLVVGITSGIIENFAYVRIREVGGSGKEMGLCRLVSSLCGAPTFWFSGPLTSKFGADRVLMFSLISYIFRFLNYAFMKHPFHALPAEALRGIAFAAFWSTGTVFAHKISPPGMSVTMVSGDDEINRICKTTFLFAVSLIKFVLSHLFVSTIQLMFMNAMYGGLGQSTGAIIGGKLQSKVGTTKTFLYSALVDAIFVCGMSAYLSLRKDSSFKNPKPITPPGYSSEKEE